MTNESKIPSWKRNEPVAWGSKEVWQVPSSLRNLISTNYSSWQQVRNEAPSVVERLARNIRYTGKISIDDAGKILRLLRFYKTRKDAFSIKCYNLLGGVDAERGLSQFMRRFQ